MLNSHWEEYMNGKSVFLSFLSVVLFVGVVFAIVFLFKFMIIAGIAGIVLLIIPVIVQRKALDASTGILDKLIAKFIVPALFVVGAFLAIMGIAFWIQL